MTSRLDQIWKEVGESSSKNTEEMQLQVRFMEIGEVGK